MKTIFQVASDKTERFLFPAIGLGLLMGLLTVTTPGSASANVVYSGLYLHSDGTGGIITLDQDDLIIPDGGILGVTSHDNMNTAVGSITGNLANDGIIDMHEDNHMVGLHNIMHREDYISVGDLLMVSGDYAGGGILYLDVDFSTSTADYLSIKGNISANGIIRIHDMATTDSDSDGEITLIEAVNGSDKSDESFIFAANNRYNGEADLGRFQSSPFIWKLKSSGNNWVLDYAYNAPPDPVDPVDPVDPKTGPVKPKKVKPTVISEIPAYLSLPTFAYEIIVNKFDTLHQRLGELRKQTAWASFDPAVSTLSGLNAVEFNEHKMNGWVRSMYSSFNFDATKSFEISGDFGITELGFDRKFEIGEENAFYAGFYGSFISGDFENRGDGAKYGSLFAASTDVEGWSGGVYGTWFNTNGIYLDMVFDYQSLDAEIEAVNKYSTEGEVLGGSVELGYSYVVRPQFIIEPQMQFKVAHVKWDNLNDGWNDVIFSDHTYLTGRAGIRAEYTKIRESGAEIKPWLYLGMQHEFSDAPEVTYIISFESHQYDTTGNLQAGITMDFTESLQFYADAGYTTDLSNYDSWRVDCGLRLHW